MRLTKEQRDNRDQAAARAAIELAHRDGKRAGIAVDDRVCAGRMLKRVKDIATSMGLDFEVVHDAVSIDVLIGDGCVRIVPMLKEPR